MGKNNCRCAKADQITHHADWQLAAYAAGLKGLTQYATLDGRDVEHEVSAVRDKKERSDFQTVIERAIEIARDTRCARSPASSNDSASRRTASSSLTLRSLSASKLLTHGASRHLHHAPLSHPSSSTDHAARWPGGWPSARDWPGCLNLARNNPRKCVGRGRSVSRSLQKPPSPR